MNVEMIEIYMCSKTAHGLRSSIVRVETSNVEYRAQHPARSCCHPTNSTPKSFVCQKLRRRHGWVSLYNMVIGVSMKGA
jgi:hypothetical protein